MTSKTQKSLLSALAFVLFCGFWFSQYASAESPAVESGAAVLSDFAFDDGSSMDLRQAYLTLGEPQRDAQGRVSNAVLIMHGTTGGGQGFLRENFAGVLFGSGQLLDAKDYYIILPDAIGHGSSSKPSDGLQGDFPKYTYDDVVRAQYQLLSEHLGVDHLRLVTGTSMGGMLSWVWGYTYPDFMDALMPLASLPVEIAGRNRMLRSMIIDPIRRDPTWNGGHYREPPASLRSALHALVFMVSSPLQYQRIAPTREEAESYLSALLDRYTAALDANDLIYAFDSSRFYDPAPHLEQIQAPLLAINSADDQVNPPELEILERETARVPNGESVVLPISTLTRGHGTHSQPTIWGPYLAGLLDSLSGSAGPSKVPEVLLDTDDASWSAQAPPSFSARFVTTEGEFFVRVDRKQAPLGADRFYQLVSNGFYDDVRINRVRSGYIAQFGVSGHPTVTARWKNRYFADDPVRTSNMSGTMAFAMTGPATRTTQVYINLDDNQHLDDQGFSVFGHVTDGMDVVQRLYALYDESAGGGVRAGKQGPLEEGGNTYLQSEFPLLDYIISARIVR